MDINNLFNKINNSPFFKKATYYFERLSSKPIIGGMQISNSGIQYVVFEKKLEPKMFSLRLPPGVIKEGHLQDPDQFLTSLQQLHKLIAPEKPAHILQVVVSLPASVVYTQSFTVPNISDEKLKESAMLNLRMISPLPADSAYMSWQITSETLEKYELLGAFVEKSVIDDLRRALIAANFHPVVFEQPALSISHLIWKFLKLYNHPILVLYVSSDGINLSILRGNVLHFDYFRSWLSIQGENRQISRDLFDRVIADETQKVIHFTMSRFRENFEKVFLVSPGFESEIQELLLSRFQISATTLVFPEKALSSAWYVAWGAAIRGVTDLSKDRFINLNYETSADLYYEEHAVGFVRLWRNIIAMVLGFFLLVFAGTTYFLNNQIANLKERLVVSKTQINQREFNELRDKITEFNDLVKGIHGEQRLVGFWRDALIQFLSTAAENKVTVDRIEATSISSPVRVAARAPDNARILAFRNEIIKKNDLFVDVDVPLLNIIELEDGSVGFSMSFKFKPSVPR